jgi:hypothetical protein
MHAWRGRQVRVHVPGDTPQRCIDNGEDDLIPCGSGETGKERASQLVETLNLGHAVKAREASENPIARFGIAVAVWLNAGLLAATALAARLVPDRHRRLADEIRPNVRRWGALSSSATGASC